MTPRRLAGAVWRRLRYAALPRIASLHDLPERIGPAIQAISVDCFDTLVHRRCDPPDQPLRTWAEQVADAVAATGSVIDGPAVLALRSEREGALRAAAADRDHEITLEGLLADLAPRLGLPAERLLALEMACERAVLVPAAGAVEVLDGLRRRGLRIAVVSDMYWDESQVRDLLTGFGIIQPADAVLVSGTRGATKHRGGLFPLVLRELGLPASAVLHVGDHPVGDVLSPSRHGLRALWLLDREDLVRRRMARAAGSGLSSLDRAWAPPDGSDGHDRDCFLIGRDVLGPALVLFVHATLVRIGRRCGPEGATAGFLARDGWLPLRIAERLRDGDPRLAGLLQGASLAYLHISRRSCLPAAADDPLVLLGGFAEALGVHGTLRALARLLGLADGDIDRIAGGLPLDEPLARLGDRAGHLRALLAVPGMDALIARRRDEAKAALVGYLRCQGIHGQAERPLHLVDLGWRSTIQAALARAFATDPAMPPVTGHLLGNLLVERDLAPGGRSRLEPGVLVDARTPTPHDPEVVRAIALMEIGCQAPEGSTLGYESCSGAWVPTKGPVPAVAAGFRESLQAGVMARVDQLLPILRDGLVDPATLIPDARRAIARFVTHPTLSQALAFRDASFDVDIGTTARVPCIDRTLGWRDLIPPQRLLRRIRGVAWVEGSLTASRFPAGRAIHRTWLAIRGLRGRR